MQKTTKNGAKKPKKQKTMPYFVEHSLIFKLVICMGFEPMYATVKGW